MNSPNMNCDNHSGNNYGMADVGQLEENDFIYIQANPDLAHLMNCETPSCTQWNSSSAADLDVAVAAEAFMETPDNGAFMFSNKEGVDMSYVLSNDHAPSLSDETFDCISQDETIFEDFDSFIGFEGDHHQFNNGEDSADKSADLPSHFMTVEDEQFATLDEIPRAPESKRRRNSSKGRKRSAAACKGGPSSDNLRSGIIMCAICNVVRFYKFLKQTRKFGLYSCEPCRKFIYRMSHWDAANGLLQCKNPENIGCCPVFKKPEPLKLQGRSDFSAPGRCEACWLLRCLRRFSLMPTVMKEKLNDMLPLQMRLEDFSHISWYIDWSDEGESQEEFDKRWILQVEATKEKEIPEGDVARVNNNKHAADYDDCWSKEVDGEEEQGKLEESEDVEETPCWNGRGRKGEEEDKDKDGDASNSSGGSLEEEEENTTGEGTSQNSANNGNGCEKDDGGGRGYYGNGYSAGQSSNAAMVGDGGKKQKREEAWNNKRRGREEEEARQQKRRRWRNKRKKLPMTGGEATNNELQEEMGLALESMELIVKEVEASVKEVNYEITDANDDDRYSENFKGFELTAYASSRVKYAHIYGVLLEKTRFI